MIVGIDLGTTNCALAWTSAGQPVRVFEVPQLVARDEIARIATLPSFLLRLENGEEFVAGVYARDEGALTPTRQIASAKSWLVNPRVDRTAPILPWGSDAGEDALKLSPVEASARLLMHLRDAWNREHPSAPLERQPVVLTVPASFDEEARELTADAARRARFETFTLLEEPLAALYAWIAAHRRNLAGALGAGRLILVCDVGGGTTDFSLIRASTDEDELRFERIAIGEHLLLGGDNLDLALAAVAEARLAGARLTLTQRQILRRRCTAAKERLLSDGLVDRVPITILGAGRGVVGGGLTTELTRADVHQALDSGFLPIVGRNDLPARDRRVGLRELGLPYETEPAITKHLAAFLTRAGEAQGQPMLQPDAVLFNGGFFTPAAARERVLDALASWFGSRPATLENARPEAAVAVGAAFFGRLRQDPHASRSLLIRAGAARSYYVGVEANAAEAAVAVCIMPRGTDEGTRFELEREFMIQTNRPAAFTLYSSRFRTDSVSALVSMADETEFERHAPLVTTMRYGKRSRSVPLPVRLAATFTEVGTLDLWCESLSSEHRWRLAFNLRGLDADVFEEEGEDTAVADAGVVIPDEAVAAAITLLRETFGESSSRTPQALIGELETTLGHAKADWPLPVLRRLCDVLIEMEPARARNPALEVRWLNLTGFCLRPGFGSASDDWRVSELRKVYAAGLAFPKDIQNQVEWIVLWGRVAGGFSAGQQAELAQRTAAQLGLSSKKAPRLNPQIERESWRLLASLERLAPTQKVRFGEPLLERIRRDPRNTTWPWALGRLGARTPLYGPLNTVVDAAVAEQWADQLAGQKTLTAETAEAIASIAGRTGDPARDIDYELANAIADRLADAGLMRAAERLRNVVDADRVERARVFGETLPEGLQLHAAKTSGRA